MKTRTAVCLPVMLGIILFASARSVFAADEGGEPVGVRQEAPDAETASEKSKDILDFQPAEGRWIDNFGDFFRLVRSARWSRISPACGEGTTVYTYSYEGFETVDGIRGEKISGSVRTETIGTLHWTAWIGDDENILKVISEGEEVDEAFRKFAVLVFLPPLQHFLLPDPSFNRDFKQALAGEKVPGWTRLDFQKNKERIGGVEADACTVSLRHEAFGNEKATFRYGDFGRFNLMLDSVLSFGQSQTMKTEAIEFRPATR